MDVISAVELVLIAAVASVAVLVAWVWLRQRWLSRSGGAFACSFRRGRPGVRWVLGVARYTEHELEWFPAVSLSLTPSLRFERGAIMASEQRRPEPWEAIHLLTDQHIVALLGPLDAVELAMTADSLTGLLSWLEAGPPGMRYRPSPA